MNIILTEQGTSKELQRIFKASHVTVRKALNGETASELAFMIRGAAIAMGGTMVAPVEPTAEEYKTFTYKGWLCEWNKQEQEFNIYTPDEASQPKGYRNIEMQMGTPSACREFIRSY